MLNLGKQQAFEKWWESQRKEWPPGMMLAPKTLAQLAFFEGITIYKESLEEDIKNLAACPKSKESDAAISALHNQLDKISELFK